MRKAWTTIFLLCMACMICMSGLCLAKDGNWIKYHNHDSSKYYVNPFSLKAREYEGRKYLEANVDISGTQMLLALDIENGKYIVLEGHNHVTGKTTKTDISQMSQQSPTFSGIPIYNKLIHWVEKNRPDIINEIRTHNLTAPPLPSAPQSTPGVNTGAPGAANMPRSQGDAWEDIGDDIPPRNESVRPGAVEFLPIGWSQGFVAIWKSRPGSLGGDYSMRVGGFIDGRHTTEIEGFNFDVIGYDENEKPNKFRLCYTQDGRPHGYAYLITVDNLKTITVERLAYDGTGLEEWGRKRDNPAYEVPIPPVEQQSPACPYPKETYILARIKESERHRLTEKAWGSKLWPEYLFVSENAEQYGLDGYTCTDSWGSTSTKACYLSPNFSGPMAEALIAFWETDGEVEDYPSDAGDVAFEITQG